MVADLINHLQMLVLVDQEAEQAVLQVEGTPQVELEIAHQHHRHKEIMVVQLPI